MITTTTIAPLINQGFNPYLLLTPLEANRRRVDTEIKPLAARKIRDIDVGKRRELERLLKLYEEEYERKKIQEEKYRETIKNYKEVSSISTTGSIMRFRRPKD